MSTQHDCLCHAAFRQADVPRDFLHRLRHLLTCTFAVACKVGQLLEHAQRTAHRLNQFNPFELTNQAQAVDDVANRQVGCNLGRLAFFNQGQTVGAMLGCPLRQFSVWLQWVLRHALPHLRQKSTLQTANAHLLMQSVQRLIAQACARVPNRMGRLACGFALGNLVGHPAQVFDQHHTQGGGQCPQLAQRQLADVLVGI